jgi:hypothetical protein
MYIGQGALKQKRVKQELGLNSSEHSTGIVTSPIDPVTFPQQLISHYGHIN